MVVMLHTTKRNVALDGELIMEARYLDYFRAYLSTLPKSQLPEIEEVETTYFCDDEYNTNECARLVSIGQKRA